MTIGTQNRKTSPAMTASVAAFLAIAAVIVVGLVCAIGLSVTGFFGDRAEAQAMFTPERIEAIRADPQLRAGLGELVEGCRGFDDRQVCHFAFKAARTIREADLDARKAALAAALQRASP